MVILDLQIQRVAHCRSDSLCHLTARIRSDRERRTGARRLGGLFGCCVAIQLRMKIKACVVRDPGPRLKLRISNAIEIF